MKGKGLIDKVRNTDPRIRSLFIVHTSMLIFSMGNSIIVTGIWPYLQAVSCFCIGFISYQYLIQKLEINRTHFNHFIQLDRTVTLDEYGIVVAADALAQIIVAPILGYVADRIGSIRIVSMLCSLIFCLGNIFYSAISLVPSTIGNLKQARYGAMIIARFLVGIGTGTQPTDLFIYMYILMWHISLLYKTNTFAFFTLGGQLTLRQIDFTLQKQRKQVNE